MNNTIYSDGKIIGFRCYTCGKVKDRMWGEKCNECRNTEKQNNDLMNEVCKLREAVVELTKQAANSV